MQTVASFCVGTSRKRLIQTPRSSLLHPLLWHTKVSILLAGTFTNSNPQRFPYSSSASLSFRGTMSSETENDIDVSALRAQISKQAEEVRRMKAEGKVSKP